MVFRRDSKVDAFQRQISALRHQLGGDSHGYGPVEQELGLDSVPLAPFGSRLPELDLLHAEPERVEARHHREPSPVESAIPDLPPVPAIDVQTSIISQATAWKGDLDSSGSLHIHGRVEGSLTAQLGIFVAEEAEIDAIVRAASVTIAGSVRGSISCTDRFELLPHGRVVGDIQAPTIVIHDGAQFTGEISMSPVNEARVPAAAPVAVRAARGGD